MKGMLLLTGGRPALELLRKGDGRACVQLAPAGAALAPSLPVDPAAAPHLASRSLVEGLPCPHLIRVVPLRPWMLRPQT